MVAALLPAALADNRIALLKDHDILLIGSDGQAAATLGRDTRSKSELRWLPDGRHLSYLVPGSSGAKASLVVVDLAGKVLQEVAIRPATDPPAEGLRFVEDVAWVSELKIRVSGSINPRNCEMFDLDVETPRSPTGKSVLAGRSRHRPMAST